MYKVRKKSKKVEARICSTKTFSKNNGGLVIRSDPKLIAEADELLQTFKESKDYANYENIHTLHKFFDKVSRSIGDGRSVCQRGCAHCCNLDIDLDFFEARYIAHHLDLTLIDRNKRVRKGYEYDRGNYCPFLNQRNGACSIYKYRPIVCRSFITFDSPAYCADRSYPVHALFSIDKSAFFPLYQRLVASSGGKFADIREWFVEYNVEPYKNAFTKDFEIDFKDVN